MITDLIWSKFKSLVYGSTTSTIYHFYWPNLDQTLKLGFCDCNNNNNNISNNNSNNNKKNTTTKRTTKTTFLGCDSIELNLVLECLRDCCCSCCCCCGCCCCYFCSGRFFPRGSADISRRKSSKPTGNIDQNIHYWANTMIFWEI